MIASLRILFDVLSFRLRRLEMANMVSAGAIMWALHVPLVWEGLIRLAFALALNVLVYLNNDYHDLEEDLDATGRERERTQFLADNRAAALGAQLFLVGALLAFALWWGGQLWRPLVFGGGICWLYSAALKRRPVSDIVAMIVWGATMPMVGVVSDSTASWLLLAQLGLFSGVFESIQVLRDHDEDALANVRTTAVAIGPGAMAWVIRVMLLAVACFAGFTFHPLASVGPALAMLVPPASVKTARYWNVIRLLLGLTFLGECALLFSAGG